MRQDRNSNDSKLPSAENLRKDYEFQERCGKSADSWLKSTHGDGIATSKHGNVSSDFSNHYNAKLNKCFALIVDNSHTATNVLQSWYLYDVHQHKKYAGLIRSIGNNRIFMCNVLDVVCANADDWHIAIKPYMTD